MGWGSCKEEAAKALKRKNVVNKSILRRTNVRRERPQTSYERPMNKHLFKTLLTPESS